MSIFDGNNGNLASKKERRPTKLSSYNEFNPPSRGNYDKPSSRDYYQGYNPQPQNNYYDQHPGYPYGQGNVHASPFQSAANLLMNPISPAGYHPNGNMFQPMYQQQPMQGIDPYTGLPIAYPQETKKVDSNSKTAEILMSSLEKQNQILAELTGSINKDRDYKVIQEAKEIENKIRQLEFESQAKQHQLFSQNTFDALSQNYNSIFLLYKE